MNNTLAELWVDIDDARLLIYDGPSGSCQGNARRMSDVGKSAKCDARSNRRVCSTICRLGQGGSAFLWLQLRTFFLIRKKPPTTNPINSRQRVDGSGTTVKVNVSAVDSAPHDHTYMPGVRPKLPGVSPG